MTTHAKCLAIILSLFSFPTNANSINYECKYKNIEGINNILFITFNNEKSKVYLKDLDQSSSSLVKSKNEKLYFEFKSSAGFKNIYELDEKTLDLKYDLHLVTLGKINHFYGRCEISKNNLINNPIEHKKYSNADLCKAFSELAEKIMKMRQAGVPLSKVMEIANKQNSTAEKMLVMEAYEHPRLNSKEYIQKSTENFRDEWYLNCTKEPLKFSF